MVRGAWSHSANKNLLGEQSVYRLLLLFVAECSWWGKISTSRYFPYYIETLFGYDMGER